MEGYLDDTKIDYVLFHLNNEIELNEELKALFVFVKNSNDQKSFSRHIIFHLSENPLEINKVISVDGIPILFPVLQRQELFYVDECDNLVFCHDLIKTCFYLLSGYQEYSNPNSSDKLKRFAFTDSVQHKLNFAQRPIVNYHFDFIANAIEFYLRTKSIVITRKRLFENFGFLLTHDIDKVDLYDIPYIIYKAKEIFRIKKHRLSTFQNTKLFTKAVLSRFHLRKNDNPYWNFDFLRNEERKNNFRSVFYFLDQGIRNSDAYYSFNEPRLIKLFKFLKEENCEIGLHGTVKSKDNRDILLASLTKLTQASNALITGNRQHRLLWKHPTTAKIELSCGLQYDTTLGFAAHEGFRNSYCLPFKLFDFDKNQIIDLWEFPLNVMDVTLFAYQSYTIEHAKEKCVELMKEISRFGGVFNLLWHNSFFDEVTYPGITSFYVDLLKTINKLNPENILGNELHVKILQFSNKK